MNVSVDRLVSKKLADEGGDESESEDDKDVN